MAIDLNTTPYYDDFDEFKNFHQLLFKPGYAVQARELTQLQSILRNQIEKFGNHIFKHGSVVIPGNSIAELNVPCIKLNEKASDGVTSIVASQYEGLTLVGETTGIRAIVKKAVEAGVGNPAYPATFYLAYLSGSGEYEDEDGTSPINFKATEVLYVEGNTGLPKVVVSGLGAGSLAYVNEGVYYINGTFVSTEKQTVVMNAYNTTLSALSVRVALKITEEIVTSNDDETLLDPAQGSYNFAAPGADRLKVSLTLVAQPLSTALDDEHYVELIRYNKGVLEVHVTKPKYNELEKTLARRTYDESGDYIVSGFDVATREHKRLASNGGVYTSGDSKKLVYDVSAGRGYINGFEVESLSAKKLETWKARTISNIDFNTDYVAKNPDVVIDDMVNDSTYNWTLKHEVKDKYSSVPRYGQYVMVSNLVGGGFNIVAGEQIKLYSRSASGSVIGTANIFALDLHYGDGVNTDSVYKAYIYNIRMTGGSINDVGRIESATTSAVKAFVVSEYLVTVSLGTFVAGNVVSYNGGTRSGTVASWNPRQNLLYIYRHAAASMPIVGDVIKFSTTAEARINSRTTLVTVGQNSVLFALPHNGVNTLKVGASTYDLEQTTYRTVTILPSNSQSGTIPADSGEIVPLEAGNFIAVGSSAGLIPYTYFRLDSGVTNRVSIVPGSNFGGVIVSGSTSGSETITLYIQTRKVGAAPKIKTKTTKVDSGLTPANVITLTRYDAIALTSIVSTVDGDVTNRFALDNGQNDYAYDYAKLKLKLGFNLPSGTLTATYTYFSHSGTGDYFSVDSYTSLGSDYLDNIPTYVSPVDGKEYSLRDCIDYRSSISSNAPIVIDSTLKTTYYRCVPRTDVVVVGKDGNPQVITGTPGEFAPVPSIPSGYHALQTIYIPGYTSSAKSVKSSRTATIRQTMKDITDIGTRISKLEEFTTLTALENEAVQTKILDAKTGLDRFKTGYLVENFTSPMEIADYLNNTFSASWNNHGLIAKLETVNVPLKVKRPVFVNKLVKDGGDVMYREKDGSNGIIRTQDGFTIHKDGFVTLNYTTTESGDTNAWVSQLFSTNVINLNPFMITSWNGTMSVIPPKDVWEERIQLAQQNVTQEVYGGINYIDNTTTEWVDPSVWDMETSQIAGGQGVRDEFGFFTYIPPPPAQPILETASSTESTMVGSSDAVTNVSAAQQAGADLAILASRAIIASVIAGISGALAPGSESAAFTSAWNSLNS